MRTIPGNEKDQSEGVRNSKLLQQIDKQADDVTEGTPEAPKGYNRLGYNLQAL